MAREQKQSPYADQDSNRGWESQRRHTQHEDDRWSENDDMRPGNGRGNRDSNDWSSSSRFRDGYSDGQGSYDSQGRGRGGSQSTRHRGRAEWGPYDRNPTNYSQRNDTYGQADGAGFASGMGGYQNDDREGYGPYNNPYSSQGYGQSYGQGYGQGYGQDYGSPMHRSNNSPGYPSQGGRTVTPTNGPWRGMQQNQYFGDTQGDTYGGGGYMRNREQYGGSASGDYGADFGEDGFGSLRSRQREGNGPSGMGGSMQSFSGRGPKGWKRSDERIQEEVSEKFERHNALDASEIEVKVKDGEVTLTGTTSDRQMKRLAEDIADQVSGVREVQNQIRVQRANGSSEGNRGMNGEATDSRQQSKKNTPMTS